MRVRVRVRASQDQGEGQVGEEEDRFSCVPGGVGGDGVDVEARA